MDLLWIAFTLRFVYSNVTYPFCILSATPFPLSSILLSQPFWGFQCFFVPHIYMLWFYTPFITTLLCQCLSIHGCAFSSFLPLLWCRNLSLVQAAPSSEPDYISIYRLLLTFRNLTLFMCSNLLVAFY